MRTITYYSNRKLYDTTEKRYTNLSEIILRVQSGELIQVVTKDGEEDVTNHTMREALEKLDIPTSNYVNLIKSYGMVQSL